jgi:AraC family transcriptional regulator of adaptative response/methylated-DNA-[protein]-cysteine methyltransferase
MRWVCCSTRLGPLLIAATARGVCFAQFGDSPGALLRRLQAEFPRAALLPGAAGRELDDWMQALDAHLEGRGPRPRVPLDLRGTLFQVQVWSFLSALQDGETLSYAALARSLGRPSATRAVAAACAANRIAVLVPCHQVLRSDGGLGGYRWGVSRKQALLETQNSSPSGSG